jgi:RND family efflux transporter MFP subunit
MKNILKSSLVFIKSHKILSIIILLAVIFIAWYFIKNSSENIKYTEVSVERGTLTEIVSVTGNVKPLSDVNLAFELGGRVANINVAVGGQVYTGQVLASVSNADLVASLDQAKANLKKVQAGLGDSALQTELTFSQSQTSLINTIKDSYTKADDAVRNKMFTLFNDPVKYRASLAFSTDIFLKEDIEEGKDNITDALDSWYRSLAKFSTTSDLEIYYNEAKLNLTDIKKILDKCAEAVNGLSPESAGATQTQIDTWKANISLARTNTNTAIDTLTSSFDQYKNLGLSVRISKNSILAEEASVEQAQAMVASAEANLAKSIIRSPINGVITNIDIKLGEIVQGNKTVLSVISYGDYEVESFIPEADISKIKIGDSAMTTLDAYGNSVVFNNSIVKIDPAATVIDGVPTYKVTLKFDVKDDRVRSGMTANLDILTNKKDNVLFLPSRVIVTKDDGKYVSMLDANDKSELIEKKVITGLRGSDGNVEVISGLNEGDKVVAL